MAAQQASGHRNIGCAKPYEQKATYRGLTISNDESQHWVLTVQKSTSSNSCLQFKQVVQRTNGYDNSDFQAVAQGQSQITQRHDLPQQ